MFLAIFYETRPIRRIRKNVDTSFRRRPSAIRFTRPITSWYHWTEIQLDTHSFPNEQPTRETLGSNYPELGLILAKATGLMTIKGYRGEPLALLRISTSCFFFRSSVERMLPTLASNWREERERERVAKRTEEAPASCKTVCSLVSAPRILSREYYPGDRFYNRIKIPPDNREHRLLVEAYRYSKARNCFGLDCLACLSPEIYSTCLMDTINRPHRLITRLISPFFLFLFLSSVSFSFSASVARPRINFLSNNAGY